MSKPRAIGADAVVLIAKEVTYGTAVSGTGGGVYTRPLLKSDDVSASQPLEADQLWNGASADDSDASLGAFDVSGNLVVPLDARGAGFWLSMALGAEAAPTDNGDDTFTHAWESGQTIESYTIQTGHPQLATPKWRTALGAKAGGFSFTMARTGRAQLTIPMIAQSEVKDTTGARDAAPLSFAYLPFDNATGSIKLAGVALASVTGGQITFSNSPEAVATIRPDMFIEGVDEGIRTLTGSFELRLGTDHSIDDLVDATSPGAVELSFAIRSKPTWKLIFSLPRVFFELSKKPISGPGGIAITCNWRAAYDATAGHMLGVSLLNDVEAY